MAETTELQNQGEFGQLGLGEQENTEDVSDLPAEVANSLDQFEDGSRQIFIAAFKSATRDGMSSQGAMDVAHNSLKENFTQSEDGKWRLKSRQVEPHQNKAIQSGGN